jgi:hypothetical protein
VAAVAAVAVSVNQDFLAKQVVLAEAVGAVSSDPAKALAVVLALLVKATVVLLLLVLAVHSVAIQQFLKMDQWQAVVVAVRVLLAVE